MKHQALALALVLAAVVALAAAAPAAPELPHAPPGSDARVFQPALLHQPKLKWWQTGVIYQIYPASFKDSDDDGIGDLNGITENLEYLKDLGVAAIWLSPIYKSPNKDMGYDISDFKDIHPNYGNLEDFEKMVEKAHSLGLKVILDFVPNHSSDEHGWFREALKGPENPYHDYYVWHNDTIDSAGKREPPTNWGSIFADMKPGSAWQWVDSLKKYYYRTFHQGQPDLNYRNPIVVQEMKNVFRFWARKGVDGFRIDAIPYLFEDRLLRDNSGNERTENLPETYDMVRQWRQVFDEEGARLGKDLVMMLEAYADVPHTMKYYGTKDFPAGHFPFNFQFISNIRQASTASDYQTQINVWNDNKPAFGWSNWVVGNHDNHRVGSRLGEGMVDGINMLVLLLPGTAVTYYGEELGMLDNTDLKLSDCKDPQACPSGADEDYYKDHSRDFERTPFHWTAEEHAGFTKGKPWLPVPEESYKTLNVQVEKNLEASHLNIYKKLAALRQQPIVQTGTLTTKSEGNVLSFLRQNDTYSLLVLINLNNRDATFNAINNYGYIGYLEEIVSSNFDAETIDLSSVSLKANAAVVLGGPRYKWWQTGVVYQIYPRSFRDELAGEATSGTDGIGDIPGITSKLEYLKSLGVNTVWLSPIFKSPDVDMGYDISDFRAIHSLFGTMAHFETMVTKAHNLGLKVVLDFVPNHVSDEHNWFEEALKGEKDSKYYNYFVWKEAKDGGTPNNWRSVFSKEDKDGTAWELNDKFDMYYLHQFHVRQPDLNYNNPDVVEEIKNVLKFWIGKGVDGFRVDAVHHLFEDPEWKDNPEWSNENLVHQDATYDMIQQWRALLDEEGKRLKKDLVLMLEVWAGGETLKKYFGTAEKPGGHFPFNFFLITEIPDLNDKYEGNRRKVKATDVVKAIDDWKVAVPDHGWNNWVLGNHDKHRIGSRVGGKLIDAFNMLATLLPGTTVTYYGEEIGMLDNYEIHYDDCKDDPGCPPEDYEEEDKEEFYKAESRDFERTPFQWDDTDNSGFCDKCTPWLPIHNEYKEWNVRLEEFNRRSHLFNYKKLVNLRKEPAIQSGALEVKIIDENVLCVSRKNDSYAYLVLINFGDKEQIVNVAEEHENIGAVKESLSSGFTSTDVDLSAVVLPSDASVVLEGSLRKVSTEPEDLKWWQTDVIYQIYPRSFQDSDGDGIGDLQGVTSRLEYLRDLGITAVWFSPIFSSPDADIGYDISDFKNINDIFGTLGDFDELIQEAHRLGLKVVLDFVPNHSSDEHAWFKDIVENGEDSPYYDYYVWHEGKNDGAEKPNNWRGTFTKDEEGSAWSKYPLPDSGSATKAETKNYYLHQFHWKQPDLNYRNPEVVREMKDVLSFWVRRGVDGFRVDAIQHLVEDKDFRDNTAGQDRDMQMNQPLTYEIIKEWRDLLDREGALLQKDIVLMLEVYTDVEPLMEYFGSELRPAGDFPFNFYTISDLNSQNLNTDSVMTMINKWEDNKPEFGWSNWVVGNHDNHRVGSRLRSELIDAFNMMVLLLPGTAITYNGEELGMLNNNALTVADCQDPQACPLGSETPEEYYQEHTRDYERTPIQWDDSDNAGFTSGTPWLPVHTNYKTVNVKVEEEDSKSHLNVYKKLAALRKQLAIQRGEFHMEKISTNVFSFSRRNVSHAYVVVINFGSTAATVELNKINAYVDLPKMLKYVGSANFNVEDEAEVSRETFQLPGYASVVLTSEPVMDNEDFSDESTTQGSSALSPLSLLLTAAMTLCWFLRT